MAELYPYLEEVIQDPSRRKVVITGRRVGRTKMIVEDAVRRLEKAGPEDIGVIVERDIYGADQTMEYLLHRIPAESIQRRRPHEIHFKSGAKLYVAAWSEKVVRGRWVSHLWVHDPDHAEDPTAMILSLLVCAADSPVDPYILIAGTPYERMIQEEGKEDRRQPSVFRSPYLRAFKRFWLPSWLSPHWSPEIEDYCRKLMSPEAFAQEFLAAC